MAARTSRIPIRAASLFCWSVLLLANRCEGADLFESFVTEPRDRGWKISGDHSLFAWNPGRQTLDVTWDSSRSNSFFHLPLNSVLTKAEDFQLTFVLRMNDIRIGSTPGKPAEFPIAIGLVSRQLVTNQNAFRGAGVSSLHGVKNIVEWNFFPDAGFGDTWATTVVSSNNVFAFGHTFPLPLIPGDTYRITLAYTASNQILRTTGLRNGQPVGTLETVSLAGTPDLRLDAFSISSYSDAVQVGPIAYHGSVLAHGEVEDVSLTFPLPASVDLVLRFEDGAARADFLAASNWVHALERSADLLNWSPVSAPMPGTGGRIMVRDTNAPAPGAFYRVRSERP